MIQHLAQQYTTLSEARLSLLQLNTERMDTIEKRQSKLRNAIDGFKKRHTVQTAINTHVLKACERTEKDAASATLKLKGWHGFSTIADKKELVRLWCSHMEPAIPINEYRVSTDLAN